MPNISALLRDLVAGTMNRGKTLQILLVLFGLLFVAGYPLVTSIRSGWLGLTLFGSHQIRVAVVV
jgi:hypothetical protein